MITWEIFDGTNLKTFAEWGIANANLARINQGSDIFTFEVPGAAIDDDPIFAADSTITVYRDGVQWFVGRVVKVPAYASGTDEGQSYRAEGPWWYFENLVHEQTWYQATDPTSPTSSIVGGNSSTIIFNQGFNGAVLTTGAQIAEAVAWAVTNGAPLQATTGTSSATSNGRVVFSATASGWPNLEVPQSDGQDVTVAEVIRKMLRWTPDAVTWFDYSTSPPTFHVGQRSGLTAQSLALTAMSACDIAPRNDLTLSAVCLRFRQQQQLDALSWVTTTPQIYPPAAIDTGGDIKASYRFGALIATIDLMGATTIHNKVSIVAPALETEFTAARAKAWWQSQVPWLADPRITGSLVLSATTRTGNQNLRHELVSGSVPEWTGYTAEEQTLTVYASYTVVDTATGVPIGETVVDEKITVRKVMTDAVTGTYRDLAVGDSGEAIPVGLAEQIYNAAGALQYEGSITLTSEDVPSTVLVGNVLNITGGRTAWASMRALVQAVDESIDNGTTRITIGPAQHLGPQDLVELLRVNRLRILRTRISTRTTGQGGNRQEVDQGVQQPVSDAVSGARKLTALEMKGPQAGALGTRMRMDVDGVRFDDLSATASVVVTRNNIAFTGGGVSARIGLGGGGYYPLDIASSNGSLVFSPADVFPAGGQIKLRSFSIPIIQNGAVVAYDDVQIMAGPPTYRLA